MRGAALVAALAAPALAGPAPLTDSPTMDDFGDHTVAKCMCGAPCTTDAGVHGICQDDYETCMPQPVLGRLETMSPTIRGQPFEPRPVLQCPDPVCLTGKTDVMRDDLWVAKVAVTIDFRVGSVRILIKGPQDGWFGAGFGGQRMEGTYAIVCEDEANGGPSPHERILGNHNPGRPLPPDNNFLAAQEVMDSNRVCKILKGLRGYGVDGNPPTDVDPTIIRDSIFSMKSLKDNDWMLPIIAAQNANSPTLSYHGRTRGPGMIKLLPCAGHTQWPTGFPSRWPTGYPFPTGFPSSGFPSSGFPSSGFPSRFGITGWPSGFPSTGFPSTGFPTKPTKYPTGFPVHTGYPVPTGFPTKYPWFTRFPTWYPWSRFPSRYPTPWTRWPTGFPSGYPTFWPWSRYPSAAPSKYPTWFPFGIHTRFPSASPSRYPTYYPWSWFPSGFPSGYPTRYPWSWWPTGYPSGYPTGFPSASPTKYPRLVATKLPALQTALPFGIATKNPALQTALPFGISTRFPSASPTKSPWTSSPTRFPRTSSPTRSPRTQSPSMSPTRSPRTPSPTRSPRTPSPTRSPTRYPALVLETAHPFTLATKGPVGVSTRGPFWRATRGPVSIAEEGQKAAAEGQKAAGNADKVQQEGQKAADDAQKAQGAEDKKSV